jgi:hypothetical protein
MSLLFKHLTYLKYHKGNGMWCCHLDAVHATPPKADLNTDKIVLKLIKILGIAGIIGTVSRTQADLNRAPDGTNNDALHEYKKTLRRILDHLCILDDQQLVNKPFLHLSIHGMQDVHYGPHAIEVGTLNDASCSPEMRIWLQAALTDKARTIMPEISIVFDRNFSGDKSLAYHRHGDGIAYPGYGPNFHSFQIEFSRTLRQFHRDTIVLLLAEVIQDFQSQFVTWPTAEEKGEP